MPRAAASSAAAAAAAAAAAPEPAVVVLVTVPTRDAGRALARSVVGAKLAACVNIVPGVESVYEWRGALQADAEELLLMKTRAELVPALVEHVRIKHVYDEPEVVALPIAGGSASYLKWVADSTRGSAGGGA